MQTDKNQNKYLAMLVLSFSKEALSVQDILLALMESSGISPAEASDALEELIEDDLAQLTQNKMCILSPKGEEILPDFFDSFRHTALESMAKSALTHIKDRESMIKYESLTEPASDGTFLICRKYEGNIVKAEVRIHFDSEEECAKAKASFDSRAEAEINAVMAVITGEADYIL